MRAIQTTKIVHKTLQIPIRVCNTVKSSSKSRGLNNACPDCHGFLAKPNVCRACDKEVQGSDVLKKYVISKDEEQILTTEQLDQLENIDKDINVVGSIDQKQFRSSLIVGSYYLLPSTKLKLKSEQKQVEKNKTDYARMRQVVLTNPEPIAVKFSIGKKQKIGVLTVESNTIVLLIVAFNEHVQEVTDEELDIKLSDKDKELSQKMIKSIKKTDLTNIKDTYVETLERVLSGKTEQQDQEKEDNEKDLWGSL